ncbi:tetratricopeptide repeat protein [Dapis sp. BLCC M172]|uniref:tetratricopeptide repeat protein n=1 Tax=Dapis sp. BLCC M172 TaxID=2975281 RepID=UPI003CEDB5BC
MTMTQKQENTVIFFNSVSGRILSHLIAVLLTLGGVWLFQNRPVNYAKTIPLTPDPINLERYNKEQPINYSANTVEVEKKIAIEQFKKNDIEAGKKAVDSLLNRGAFLEAKEALNILKNVSENNKNIDPEIDFLYGRLAWELAQDGNRNYNVDEALFYWEKAVSQRPDSILYQNAIGFAYYTKGELKKAYDAWEKVLKLSGEILPETERLQNISTEDITTPEVEQKDALNAYAGIGLVMMKSAKNSQGNDQRDRWLRALQYRTKVMSEAAKQYHIPELRKNWLWSRVALRDWDFLMRTDWNILRKRNN